MDGRDLARAHVEALLRPDAGNKRYTVAAPERFSYQLAAEIIENRFEWAKGKVQSPGVKQEIDDSHDLDGRTAAGELGITYRSFEQTLVDTINQALKIKDSPSP